MTPNVALDRYWKSISVEERRAFLKKLLIECNISRNNLYDYRAGRTRLYPIHMRKINQVVGRDIFGGLSNCEN